MLLINKYIFAAIEELDENTLNTTVWFINAIIIGYMR